RRALRARANLVLTNPDMLHSGILPHHTKWAVLFQNLECVVIDELHAYRGVFGSHLANVLRRLRRICAHYGSTPQFIMASATIGHPRALAARLTGDDVEELAESGAAAGEVLGVVVATARGLAGDTGHLHVAIRGGYPGTIASLWQQAGRAGRRSGPSAAILIATSAPLDQFMVTHPDYLFGTPPEHARVNPDNPFILANHLKCAAFELPLVADEPFGGTDVRKLAAALEDEGVLHRAGERYHWASETYPADHISLRTVTTDNFVVIDTTARDAAYTKKRQIIAEVDWGSAFATIYPKAIYLVESVPYEVQ